MTTERLTPLTDLERDALAELANVAMARASVSLRHDDPARGAAVGPERRDPGPERGDREGGQSRAIPIWSRCGRISAACSPDVPC